MRAPSLLTTLALTLSSFFSTSSAAQTPYFILTGDSTVAVNGGWGDGFLSFLADPADGINSGKSGATTVSFRANGRWDAVLSGIADHKADYEPIVTIQFGHNDQKSTSGISLEQFGENLQNLANEVIEAGGTPIIITSLTRRNFDGSTVIENLADHSAKAIEAAEAIGIQYLDLNRASTDYVNAIGEENAHTYDLSDGDGTHLNTAGETVFGRLVADLLLEKRDDLEEYFTPNEELSRKIEEGEYATGDE
ncbi:hypothetical protein N8T08_008073 [Aspergillus melleus]|uniref:Uncharacterized protein n=1 Tax=Aspergillus melleus TaxID=138277 RepID=A0ACC3AWR3_9EURO|nr:hypothetical protein N8T08_008073 [Aspergillus melleus]